MRSCCRYRHPLDDAGPSDWSGGNRRVQRRSADYRLYRAVVLPGRPGLPLRASSSRRRCADEDTSCGESFARIFAGVLAPFLLAPYTASPSIFFGTMVVVVAVGAAIPVLYGRETLGQLETFTEALPELA